MSQQQLALAAEKPEGTVEWIWDEEDKLHNEGDANNAKTNCWPGSGKGHMTWSGGYPELSEPFDLTGEPENTKLRNRPVVFQARTT